MNFLHLTVVSYIVAFHYTNLQQKMMT